MLDKLVILKVSNHKTHQWVGGRPSLLHIESSGLDHVICIIIRFRTRRNKMKKKLTSLLTTESSCTSHIIGIPEIENDQTSLNLNCMSHSLLVIMNRIAGRIILGLLFQRSCGFYNKLRIILDPAHAVSCLVSGIDLVNVASADVVLHLAHGSKRGKVAISLDIAYHVLEKRNMSYKYKK